MEIVQLRDDPHFHYEASEVEPLELRVSLDSAATSAGPLPSTADDPIVLRMDARDEWWRLRRSWRQILAFDAALHRCVFDRSFSRLPHLAAFRPLHRPFVYDQELEQELVGYWHCLSKLAAGSTGRVTVTCHSVLRWLELDKHGRRLHTAEETPINTPAMAAAFAKRAFQASLPEHLGLAQGDIVSVIDMSDPDWWKGKLTIALSAQNGLSPSASTPAELASCHYASTSLAALPKREAPSSGAYFKVGFFPASAVQLFGEKAGGSRCEVGPTSLRPSVASVSGPDSSPNAQRKGRILTFLRGFLLTRPSRKKLKAQGILRERVFGCDLSELLANTGQELPPILTAIAAAIEATGRVDGIYRLSGRVSNIQRLRLIFDEGRVPEELEAGNRSSLATLDVHSLAALLKAYFRELPNPLFTSALCPAFEAVLSQHSEPAGRVPALQALVRSLPPPHYRTAAALMRHLWRVAEWASDTGMHHQNLAIVWAPNLFRSREVSGSGECGYLLRSVNVQSVITGYLIRYQERIFSESPGLSRSLCSLPSTPPLSPLLRPASAIVCTAAPPPVGLVSPAAKLLHLSEAQAKLEASRSSKIPAGAGLPDLANRKCIDVNGGPAAIPEFHTGLEVAGRGKRRGRREWRELLPKRRGGAAATGSTDEESSGAYGSLSGLHVKGWDARRQSRRRSSSRPRAAPETPPASATPNPDFRSQPDLRPKGSAEQELRSQLQRHSSPSPPAVPPPPRHYAAEESLWASSGLRPSPASSLQASPRLRLGEEAASLGFARSSPAHLDLSPEWLRAAAAPLHQPMVPVTPSPEPSSEAENPDRPSFFASADYQEPGRSHLSLSEPGGEELSAHSGVFSSAAFPDDPAVSQEHRLIEELKEAKVSPSREEVAGLPPTLGQIYRDVLLSSSFETATEGEAEPPLASPERAEIAASSAASSPSRPRLRLTGVSAQEDLYVEETLALPEPLADQSPASSIQVIAFQPPLLLGEPSPASDAASDVVGVDGSVRPPIPAPRRSLSQPPTSTPPLSIASVSVQLGRSGWRKPSPPVAASEDEDELHSSPLFRKQAEALSDAESSPAVVRLAEAAEPLPEGELRFFASAPPPPSQMFFV